MIILHLFRLSTVCFSFEFSFVVLKNNGARNIRCRGIEVPDIGGAPFLFKPPAFMILLGWFNTWLFLTERGLLKHLQGTWSLDAQLSISG